MLLLGCKAKQKAVINRFFLRTELFFAQASLFIPDGIRLDASNGRKTEEAALDF